MGTAEQIFVWLLWLFDTIGITVLIAIVIYIHRKNNEKHDAAAEERAALKRGQRTLIDRIERMQSQLQEAQLNVINYIIFDGTRYRIVEKAAAFSTDEGKAAMTGKPFNIPEKYRGKKLWLYAVLADGEDAEMF